MTLELISGLVGVVPELTAQFNGKYQDNQLGIAQANARAAEAAAVASGNAKNNDSDNQNKIIIGVVVAIVVIGIIWKISNK